MRTQRGACVSTYCAPASNCDNGWDPPPKAAWVTGAVTAALFLADFVPESQEWLHLDLFAWNDGARPGRPVGGEAQTVRTLMAYLEERFGD